MDKSMTIGQRINILRKQRGLSVARLAKKLYIPQSTICNWVYHGAHPDIDFLIRIADLFDMSLDDLVGREYHSTKSQVRGG